MPPTNGDLEELIDSSPLLSVENQLLLKDLLPGMSAHGRRKFLRLLMAGQTEHLSELIFETIRDLPDGEGKERKMRSFVQKVERVLAETEEGNHRSQELRELEQLEQDFPSS